ncbi:MAG: SpoIIE family protein phosphatase, partial [Lachnospiraceae bacterium]|nr:SpoIIE family protein phosphatase [Lachnospiraceae bacterium]
HLDEGSKLFVYTDGVKEAANPKNQMFGTDRMLNTLNNNKSSSPKELLNCMRIDVDKFSDGAEQFDDLTMLCIEYYGPKGN